MSEQRSIIDEIAGPEPEDEGAGAAAAAEGAGDGEAAGAADDAAPEGEGKKAPAAADADGDKTKFVPQAALHEERTKRQEAQRELDAARATMASMEKLFAKITAGEKPKGEEEPELPDFAEDPAGHLAGKIEQLQKQLAQIGDKDAKRTEAEKQQETARQVLDTYARATHEYAAKVPDFKDAYDYLAQAVDAELLARGYTDPIERQNVLQFEEGRLVGRAMQQGKNPAEVIYGLAKHRGYTGKKPAAANGQNGGEADKLARLKEGQAAAKSLAGGGSGAEGVLSLEELVKLADTDPAKFDAEWERARKRGMLG